MQVKCKSKVRLKGRSKVRFKCRFKDRLNARFKSGLNSRWSWVEWVVLIRSDMFSGQVLLKNEVGADILFVFRSLRNQYDGYRLMGREELFNLYICLPLSY